MQEHCWWGQEKLRLHCRSEDRVAEQCREQLKPRDLDGSDSEVSNVISVCFREQIKE